MSGNRCFETLNSTVVYGSDKTNARRQETIYREMQINSTNKGPNPVKHNKHQYNKNFISKRYKNQNDTSRYQYRLASAKSYDLLLDITKGKRFAKSINNVGHNRYKIWGGNVMQVDYKDKIPYSMLSWNMQHSNSNKVHMPIEIDVTASNEVVDKNSNIFYSPCYFTRPSHIPPWIQNVVTKNPIYKNTYYYYQGAKDDPLRGIAYPEEIYFDHQKPCEQDDTACPNNTKC